MATPNLGIVHLAAAQNQPEVTVNAMMDAIDNATNVLSGVNIADVDTTLSEAQLAGGVAWAASGALTSDRHLNLPAAINRVFWFANETSGGHNVIVQVTGAPGGTVSVGPSDGWVALSTNGTNVQKLSIGTGTIPAAINFADNETPSGSTPGTAFTLAHTPTGGSLQLNLNGLTLTATVDYTISGASITMTNPVAPADNLRAWYRY